MRLYLCQELDRSRGCPSAVPNLDRSRGYTPTFFAIGAIAICFFVVQWRCECRLVTLKQTLLSSTNNYRYLVIVFGSSW